jgi:hypothetical protein
MDETVKPVIQAKSKHVLPADCLKAQWKPGQSGNPAGRPRKAETLMSCIKAKLEEIDPKTGLTGQQTIAAMLYQKFLDGDMKAGQLMLDYGIGKPAQTVSLETKGDAAIDFRVGKGAIEPPAGETAGESSGPAAEASGGDKCQPA